MKRMLFNATYQEELRVATVEGQKLIDFDIETTSKTQRRGNIYKGVITRVEASLEACFVDYGTEKQGFLPFKEIDTSYLPESAKHRDFNKLSEGTELIVQVEKDERGNKGAALTTYVSLPGRYLVLMPNNSRSGGISRRIDGDERDELKAVLSALEVPQNMSIIARTAALGRFSEELQWDLNYLVKLWDAVQTAASNQAGSFLIYQESNLVVRSIRDHFSPDITEILIDTDDIYEQARQFMSHVMPNFVERVKLYSDDVPLFSRFQIEHQIETAYGRMVHLPSGGSIAIDHTEALTAIDVNSAKANKGSDIEATALAANMEAADEIARQLRLRDLGGLVVVDFIDMENSKNQREVENFFKQQLGLDRARIQMGKLSKFGLLELSRQRLQASLEETTAIPCPRCAGVGTIRGTESTAVHVLRIIEEEAVKNTNFISALHVQLPIAVATYLLNEKRDDVAKIESRMKVKIILIPNIHLDSPNYKIRKINNDSYDAMSHKLSYTLVENPDENPVYHVNENKSDTSLQNKAVVKNITPSQPAPVITKSSGLGKLIGKFVDLFKAPPTTPSKTEAKPTVKQEKPLAANKVAANKATNNKIRPVGVNRSNTKVQTVRPTNPNSKVNGQKQAASEITDKAENTHSTPRSNPRQNQAPQVEKAVKPSGPHDNVVERNALAKQKAQLESANKLTAPTTTQVKPVLNSEEKGINQAWKPTPVVASITASEVAIAVTPAKPQQAISNVQSPVVATPTPMVVAPVPVAVITTAKVETTPKMPVQVEVSSPVVPSVTEKLVAQTTIVSDNKLVVDAPPVVERLNTITQKIDLGDLQMVATDSKLIIPVVEAPSPVVKRHNDVLTEKVIANTDITYELVETKVN